MRRFSDVILPWEWRGARHSRVGKQAGKKLLYNPERHRQNIKQSKKEHKECCYWDKWECAEQSKESCVTHPSTAGERSGLLLPLDRYLLWLCRRGGRPGPQCSVDPSRPPIDPPIPAGTDPPIGPPPSPPRSPKPPRRPPGSRGSESGVSPSVNGRSSNKRCHSYRKDGIGQGEVLVKRAVEKKTGEGTYNTFCQNTSYDFIWSSLPLFPRPSSSPNSSKQLVPLQSERLCHLSHWRHPLGDWGKMRAKGQKNIQY